MFGGANLARVVVYWGSGDLSCSEMVKFWVCNRVVSSHGVSRWIVFISSI